MAQSGDLDTIGASKKIFEVNGALVFEDASQELGDFEKALRWTIERGQGVQKEPHGVDIGSGCVRLDP